MNGHLKQMKDEFEYERDQIAKLLDYLWRHVEHGMGYHAVKDEMDKNVARREEIGRLIDNMPKDTL
jgi:uncharacterized protein YutD